MSVSNTLSVASLNFGAINDNKFEFVDRSDPERQQFFDKVYEAFDSTQNNNTTIYNYVTEDGTYDTVTYDALFHQANSFCRKYLTPDTLRAIMGSDIDFDLTQVTLANMFTHVLTKDKGLGGFEQVNCKRTSNIVRNYHNITDLKQLQYQINMFLETYKTPLNDSNTYQEYFLKGRKEGPKVDGKLTQKNYYNKSMINQRTYQDDICYNSLGKLVLIIFDRLQFEMFNASPVPEYFIKEDTNSNQRKAQLLLEYISSNNFDIVFLQEFQSGIIQFPTTTEYSIICGKELYGQCNAIIYKNKLGTAEVYGISDSPSLANLIKEEGEDKTIIENHDQYKELPLVLGIQKNNITSMILVSYHSSGKGILDSNKSFADSDVYKFMKHWSIPVIVGADFNCNIRNSLGNVDDTFSLFPHIDEYAYTTFKERSPLQAQFDKVGKLDRKVKDSILSMNCIMDTDTSGICMLDGTEITDKTDINLCLPKYLHPFDHYILESYIAIKEETYYDIFVAFIKNFFGWTD